MLDGGMCSLFTKEYGSQCSLRCLNVKQINNTFVQMISNLDLGVKR